MNSLRSLIGRAIQLTPFTSRTVTTSTVVLGEKIPAKKKKAKSHDKAAAAAAQAALVAIPGAPIVPVKKKKEWNGLPNEPTLPPGCVWVKDMTIPRDSVLSHNPHRSHNWQDWRMLRDVKRRAYVHIYHREKMRWSALYRSVLMPKEIQEDGLRGILSIPRDAGFRRVVNRCQMTSRARAVLTRWKLSRIAWRHLADYNLLSGTMRAKWGNRNNKIYWHNIEPPLEGTLAALHPLPPRQEHLHWKEANQYSGMARPKVEYNMDIFKSDFVYPKHQR